tara:strand:- start:1009 stop:1392 length:384 start_codon:yes stop_codon:yes gene_type:complete
MDLNKLESKLLNISKQLEKDKSLELLTQKIESKNLDQDDKINIRQNYYSTLPKYEKLYQIQNNQYKDLIQQFSIQYLELSDFYVGPELPREHYLQSKKDVIELYKIFTFFAICEPFINAFYNKFNQS